MVRRSGLFLLLLTSAYADVTLRYKTTVTASPVMPPEAQEQLKQSGSAPITMQVKGSMGYTLAGKIGSITDLQKQTTTVLNTDKKTFASIPSKDYEQAVAQVVPKPSAEAQEILANMEVKFESKATGRRERIQGILAEDRQIVITMATKTATGQEGAGVMMRMVLNLWSAVPGEAARVPALSEIEKFTALSKTDLDPAALIQKMMGSYSGVSKGYEALAKELGDRKSLILRTHVSVYVPSVALTIAGIAKARGTVPSFDPNAPLSEINQEVVELSTTPLSPSIFEVPAEYQKSTVEEILKTRFEK